ncbi:MAG: hypothetical protein ACU0BC_01710 [Pseudooceanicola nanhaiensis]
MASHQNAFSNNPIELRTRKALRVVGALLDKWTTDASSRPSSASVEADGRLIVFDVADLEAQMDSLPEEDRLVPGTDYHLRDGIKQIELVLRRPDRVSFLLPEPEAMKHHHDLVNNGEMPGIMLATLYRDLDKDEIEKQMPVFLDGLPDEDPATYLVHVSGKNPLDAFLHPYLASYCCAQCT